ncbi:MAG TPA: phosphoribosylglycinamide synthetase C domain-containing protein [Gemmatimonadaceae bacterium]
MRVLGIGDTTDLGDMYLRLAAAGHDVRVYVGDEHSRDVMQQMLSFVEDWRESLDWIREAGSDGIIVFENATMGEDQDDLRQRRFNVVGGSAVGDRLESDRSFGQHVLSDCGLHTARGREFSSFDEAVKFLQKEPARYVFKLNGANWLSSRNYVGQLDDARDMIALLTSMQDLWRHDEQPSFLLMEFIDGVEVGTGAFFNGERFLDPPNLDWEHKRFFPGDIGELTGEMGTVVTYRGAGRIFKATLARLAPMLRESGYCGYINLNTIINDDGIWPLELTSRFGYPGFAILDSLHLEDWGTILSSLVARNRTSISTRDGFSVGVVLTVPPFPYPDGYDELGKGTPICFRETLTESDRDSLHYGEVTMRDGELRTAGMIGYTMVVTGTGTTIEEARSAAYRIVDKVVIPNCRYRQDIGVKLMEKDWARLGSMGWIGD